MIRPATEADLQAILDIYNDAVINTTAVYTYTPHTLDMRRQWFKEHREAGLPVFVLEEDGVVAGFATYGNFRPWPAYKYSIEHSIYVHKDFRRRHIATRLMEKLLEAANGAGYATMIAGIDADNAASIRMHERFGFTFAGKIVKAGYKFGRWLDLVFYQKLLDTFRIQPEQAVFLDDRQENLEGAASLGIHTILFQKNEQASQDLEDLLHMTI